MPGLPAARLPRKQRPEPVAACREVAYGSACGSMSPSAAASRSPARTRTCWTTSRTSLIVSISLLNSWGLAPRRPLCRAQRGKRKSAQSARKFFPFRRLGVRRPGGRTGARGKGSGHMMDRSYQPPSSPPVHPTGPDLRRSGMRARRSGPGPGGHRAGPAKLVAGVDQRLGSCPRSRVRGDRGRDVAGLGRASGLRSGTSRCPSAARSIWS